MPQTVHLCRSAGLLGPTLRAEEGETIVVTFRNMATEPYSIHPHGVVYGKQSEGECLLTQLQVNGTAAERAALCVGTLGSSRVLHNVGQHNKQLCLSLLKY